MATTAISIKKFHISGLVRYLLLLLTDILALWYFHGYLFLLILYMLILALPGFAVLTYLGLKRLEINLTAPYSQLPYRTSNQIHIRLTNHTFFPLFHLNMELSEENLFLKEKRVFIRRRYKISVFYTKRNKRVKKSKEDSYFRKRSVLVFPKETITIPHTVLNHHCGNIRFTLQNIQLTDYLGIITFGIKNNYTTSVIYMPQKAQDSDYNAARLQNVHDLQKEVQKKGFDDPEPLQIREYIPGDKLNHIHWKISSKYEQLMVKEFEKEEGGRIFLAVELYYSSKDSLSEIDSVLDRTYQAALYFLQLHYRITIGWWSIGANVFLHKEVFNEDMLNEVFLEIVQEQTYTQKDLLEDYLGNDSPYILKW